MRYTSFALAGTLTTSAFSQCLTSNDALRVASNFRSLMTVCTNQIAIDSMCSHFTHYSDSLNQFRNNGCPNSPSPLGSVSFTTRQQFVDAQSTQRSNPFEILNVWHNCNAVTMRWRSNSPGGLQPGELVTEIIVFETAFKPRGPERWLIEKLYSEYNTAAWMYDVGMFRPSCAGEPGVAGTATGIPLLNKRKSVIGDMRKGL